MSAVVLGPEFTSKLNGLNEDLELRDETGRVLGHFVPSDLYHKMLSAWAELTCSKTAEELEQLRQQPGTQTWAEIKRRLVSK
jgi:hypothetical protein